jgi:crossover junction endodeoxyribonuclease RuvC
MRVLSIDPGYDRLGIAIVEKKSSASKEILVYSSCKQTSSSLPFSERLSELGSEIEYVIQQYSPDVTAIEKLYFTNNQKTAMRVAQVIGAIIYIVKSKNLEVYEYTPLQIKSACTGNGRADKKQIMTMLPHLVNIDKDIEYDDEYDAIAVGITHLAHNSI